MNRLSILSACILATGALGGEAPANRPATWAQPVDMDGLPNLHKMNANLYRSAQPSRTGMEAAAGMGIKTVVNLRSFHSDRDEIGHLQLAQVHIHMKAWHPEYAEIIEFLKVVADADRKPVLVHCQHGADRTGTLCAVYRIVVEGWTREEAIREMTEGGFGFHEVWANLHGWIMHLDVDSIRKEIGMGCDGGAPPEGGPSGKDPLGESL